MKESEPPCHQLPRAEWCDRDGPGGFMGHTCYPKSPAPLIDYESGGLAYMQRPQYRTPCGHSGMEACFDQNCPTRDRARLSAQQLGEVHRRWGLRESVPRGEARRDVESLLDHIWLLEQELARLKRNQPPPREDMGR